MAPETEVNGHDVSTPAPDHSAAIALLMGEAERHLDDAARLYRQGRAGYARRSRVRAAAMGWAAGVLKKAMRGQA